MGSDDRFYNDEDGEYDDELEPSDPPASVVFMEMMRHAAASRNPEPAQQSIDLAIDDSLDEQRRLHDANRDQRRQHAMEAQRVQRVQRRKARRRSQTVGMLGGILQTFFIVGVSAALIATILSWWTKPDQINANVTANLVKSDETDQDSGGAPVVQPTPNWLRTIGIVSGHRGPENDPGAVCPDGLTEAEINFAVAESVVIKLRGLGYQVDLLEEFDDQLADYRAEALVSIHANDCRDYGEFVSGFLVAQAEARPTGGPDTALVECVASHYGAGTGLDRRFGFTRDLTDYHIFREINLNTPGAIVELGFLKDDREFLTTQTERMATAIVDGILCYLNNEAPLPQASDLTPTPIVDSP
jgi:N-acetylmuramoyl-L-alanine amidase